jgi:hypothetical protein
MEVPDEGDAAEATTKGAPCAQFRSGRAGVCLTPSAKLSRTDIQELWAHVVLPLNEGDTAEILIS